MGLDIAASCNCSEQWWRAELALRSALHLHSAPSDHALTPVPPTRKPEITRYHNPDVRKVGLIVAELGEVERFSLAKQVGAYAGLTVRIHQSGGHCYHGSITQQGSPWLRWILVEAAMKVVRRDVALKNFYTRVRKCSSAKIARVAVARKLAEICWKRLRHWHGVAASQAV